MIVVFIQGIYASERPKVIFAKFLVNTLEVEINFRLEAVVLSAVFLVNRMTNLATLWVKQAFNTNYLERLVLDSILLEVKASHILDFCLSLFLE